MSDAPLPSLAVPQTPPRSFRRPLALRFPPLPVASTRQSIPSAPRLAVRCEGIPQPLPSIILGRRELSCALLSCVLVAGRHCRRVSSSPYPRRSPASSSPPARWPLPFPLHYHQGLRSPSSLLPSAFTDLSPRRQIPASQLTFGGIIPKLRSSPVALSFFRTVQHLSQRANLVLPLQLILHCARSGTPHLLSQRHRRPHSRLSNPSRELASLISSSILILWRAFLEAGELETFLHIVISLSCSKSRPLIKVPFHSFPVLARYPISHHDLFLRPQRIAIFSCLSKTSPSALQLTNEDEFSKLRSISGASRRRRDWRVGRGSTSATTTTAGSTN